MLQINPKFLESKAPQRESEEALAMLSQGEVWQPIPVAKNCPSSRPESRVRSTLCGKPPLETTGPPATASLRWNGGNATPPQGFAYHNPESPSIGDFIGPIQQTMIVRS